MQARECEAFGGKSGCVHISPVWLTRSNDVIRRQRLVKLSMNNAK